MTYTTILTDLSDGVFTLTFNRPEVLNAFNDQQAEEVQDALKKAERDDAVRCVVLTGAGRAVPARWARRGHQPQSRARCGAPA